jgi:hypothetical protein
MLWTFHCLRYIRWDSHDVSGVAFAAVFRRASCTDRFVMLFSHTKGRETEPCPLHCTNQSRFDRFPTAAQQTCSLHCIAVTWAIKHCGITARLTLWLWILTLGAAIAKQSRYYCICTAGAFSVIRGPFLVRSLLSAAAIMVFSVKNWTWGIY